MDQSGTGPSPNLDVLLFGPITCSQGGLWDIESIGQSPVHSSHYKQHNAAELLTGILSPPERHHGSVLTWNLCQHHLMSIDFKSAGGTFLNKNLLIYLYSSYCLVVTLPNCLFQFFFFLPSGFFSLFFLFVEFGHQLF